MKPTTSENPWVRRTRWLTQALIISGTLNIGLVATFAYFVFQDKQTSLTMELKPASKDTALTPTNIDSLRAYSLLPYQELLLRLENRDLIEEGLTKRDLALACLVAFHHFNLEKALGSAPLQKRTIPFTNPNGQETLDIPVFPGLADTQFLALLQYAKTEKWPLTSQGLFYELKRTPTDTSLLETFYLTPEFRSASTLLPKIPHPQLIELLASGEWSTLSDLTAQQRLALDLSPERRRAFLLNYTSPLSAKLILDSDPDFALHRLDDSQILTILDLYPDKSPILEKFAKDLLASPRTNAVHQRAAILLYALAGEALPEPFDHATALRRFLPQEKASPLTTNIPLPIPPKLSPKKILHTVEPGDSLWKLARKYHVTVEEIMRVNHMETEKLRPGKQIEIPSR